MQNQFVLTSNLLLLIVFFFVKLEYRGYIRFNSQEEIMIRRKSLYIEAILVLLVLSILILVMTPKFLTSQERTKVVESMQNQKEISTAIHTLYEDRGVMLIDLWDDDTDLGHEILQNEHFGVGDHTEHERWMCDILKPLTTPTAYLSHLPQDPYGVKDRSKNFNWPAENFANPGAESYLYIDNDPILDTDNDRTIWQYDSIKYDNQYATDQPGEFILIGLSPAWEKGNAIVPNAPSNYGNVRPTLVQYDSSNGMHSNGDIMFHSRIKNPKIPPEYKDRDFKRMMGGF